MGAVIATCFNNPRIECGNYMQQQQHWDFTVTVNTECCHHGQSQQILMFHRQSKSHFNISIPPNFSCLTKKKKKKSRLKVSTCHHWLTAIVLHRSTNGNRTTSRGHRKWYATPSCNITLKSRPVECNQTQRGLIVAARRVSSVYLILAAGALSQQRLAALVNVHSAIWKTPGQKLTVSVSLVFAGAGIYKTTKFWQWCMFEMKKNNIWPAPEGDAITSKKLGFRQGKETESWRIALSAHANKSQCLFSDVYLQCKVKLVGLVQQWLWLLFVST